MTKIGNVLNMLCPGVEWTVYGDKFEDIIWHNGEAPITKKQFTDGFAQYDVWRVEQESVKATQRQAILDRLGLTEDEARLLLG
jgi:hypothetical protein